MSIQVSSAAPPIISLKIHLLIHRKEKGNPNAELHARAKLFTDFGSEKFILCAKLIREVSLGNSTGESQASSVPSGRNAIIMGAGVAAGVATGAGAAAGLAAGPVAIVGGAKAGKLGAQKIIDAISRVST